MSLNEMISQFDLDALTHRSTTLDPGKLEYINKQHLMRAWSTPEGLHNLAERVHEGIKTLFPHRSVSLTEVDILADQLLQSVYECGKHQARDNAPWGWSRAPFLNRMQLKVAIGPTNQHP